MMGLTRKQAEALQFIRAYVAANEFSPRYDEIAAGLGIVKSSVHRLIINLEGRGYLTREPRAKRSIQIVDRGASVTLSPQVERAVSEYARRHRTTTQAAANELLAEYLTKVAA